jgi:hypothetical protein
MHNIDLMVNKQVIVLEIALAALLDHGQHLVLPLEQRIYIVLIEDGKLFLQLPLFNPDRL